MFLTLVKSTFWQLQQKLKKKQKKLVRLELSKLEKKNNQSSTVACFLFEGY